MHAKPILVAMDDSEASRRMLHAVADRATRSQAARVILCHLIPPLPPHLLETRGAEDPAEEIRVEDEQEIEQEQWTDDRAARGRRLVSESKRTLEGDGVAADRIDTQVVGPIGPHESLADAIIECARSFGCGTVAVGQRTFPTVREALHNHIGDELRNRANGLEVWVVE